MSNLFCGVGILSESNRLEHDLPDCLPARLKTILEVASTKRDVCEVNNDFELRTARGILLPLVVLATLSRLGDSSYISVMTKDVLPTVLAAQSVRWIIGDELFFRS